MKLPTISAVMAVTMFLVGCGKPDASSGTSPSQAKEQANGAPAAAVAQSALLAWQQGDKSMAVSKFVDADWTARPLFPTDSPLSLTEEQFQSLPIAESEAKGKEMLPQLSALKALATAVAQAGRDAAAKGDAAQAQKYFAALKQAGTALSNPDCMAIVQLVGKAFTKMADTELSKIGK
jgi:hypothetical protein